MARVAEGLAEQPTLPWNLQDTYMEHVAYDLPNTHCSFQLCMFAADTEAELLEHLCLVHAKMFANTENSQKEEVLVASKVWLLYKQALSWKCQNRAPVANASLDRRALKQYQAALSGDNIAELICFVCARRYPFQGDGTNQCIEWWQPLNAKAQTLFGIPFAEVEP